MSDLSKEWEREIRRAAKSIWNHGYNVTLTAIIRAARETEQDLAIEFYVQRDPWDDQACSWEQEMLERAELCDILGLLDNALSFGVWIIGDALDGEAWEYSLPQPMQEVAA